MTNWAEVKDWTEYVGQWVVWLELGRIYTCSEIVGTSTNAVGRVIPRVRVKNDYSVGIHPSRVMAITDPPGSLDKREVKS